MRPPRKTFIASNPFTVPGVGSFEKGTEFEGNFMPDNKQQVLLLKDDGLTFKTNAVNVHLKSQTIETMQARMKEIEGEVVEEADMATGWDVDEETGLIQATSIETNRAAKRGGKVEDEINAAYEAKYGADAALVRDEGTKGVKKDAGKPRMDLLPAKPLTAAARIFTFGAEKYDRNDQGEPTNEVYLNNWRQGMRWGRAYASLQRHLNAFWAGEDMDPETGEFHIDHALANVLMLSEYVRSFPQGDDRATPWRRMPRIGLDVDGVICDTYHAVIDAAQEKLHGPFRDSMPHYAFSGAHLEAMGAFTREEWLNLPAMMDGTELPFEPVVYVTARYDVSLSVVEEWLMRNGFPPAPVVGSRDAGKAAVLKEYGVELYVEDKYENFRDLQQAGITTFLYDQPYNRKHKVGMYRVADLHDFARKIGLEV